MALFFIFALSVVPTTFPPPPTPLASISSSPPLDTCSSLTERSTCGECASVSILCNCYVQEWSDGGTFIGFRRCVRKPNRCALGNTYCTFAPPPSPNAPPPSTNPAPPSPNAPPPSTNPAPPSPDPTFAPPPLPNPPPSSPLQASSELTTFEIVGVVLGGTIFLFLVLRILQQRAT